MIWLNQQTICNRRTTSDRCDYDAIIIKRLIWCTVFVITYDDKLIIGLEGIPCRDYSAVILKGKGFTESGGPQRTGYFAIIAEEWIWCSIFKILSYRKIKSYAIEGIASNNYFLSDGLTAKPFGKSSSPLKSI